jgi:hypothetical protein
MSAAFALDFSGDPVSCDFPGCVLDAFHEGDHKPIEKASIQWTYDRHCVVCGVPFTVLGADPKMIFSTCGSRECLLHYAQHHAPPVPITCRCPQREFPHELGIHFNLRSEAYNPKLKFTWPWSLCASSRMEPSAERKA